MGGAPGGYFGRGETSEERKEREKKEREEKEREEKEKRR